MENKELLESGKLELYALGALEAHEMKEVEQALASDAELKAEYDAIAEALLAYGKEEETVPPAHVLDKAKKEIAELDEIKSITEPRGSQNFKWWAIAASLLLVGSVVLNITQNNKISELSEDYSSLLAENQQMASNTVGLEKENEATNALIAAIVKGKLDGIYLGSTEKYDGYESVVYWSKDESTLILATNDLPELEAEEQYQLWAIVDGKPVDAGVFDAEDRMAEMKEITGNVAAFAVTIEPKGGSVNPTLEKMVMIGNVEA
jgi:anti-sigma-K factor RskA